MEWASYLEKKNEGILFPTEIRVVGSYTDRLLNCKKPQTNMLRNSGSIIDTVNSARLNILRENYTGNFSRQTRHPPIELKTEWGCSCQQLLKF